MIAPSDARAAWQQGWISDEQLIAVATRLAESASGQYLMSLLGS